MKTLILLVVAIFFNLNFVVSNNCHDGMFFNNNTLFGEQGTPTLPSDNKWISTGGFTPNSHTFANFTDASGYIFHVRNLPAYYKPTINIDIAGAPITVNSFDYTGPDICDAKKSTKSTKGNKYELERKIAKNEIKYEFNPQENQWLSKQYLFKRIKEEPEMLDADPIFEYAQDSLETTNIGKLHKINEMLNDTAVSISKVISNNNAINPNNIIEENYKKVNQIYLETFASGIDTLTTIQINDLIIIAEQCPYTSGTAVYSARVMLRMVDDKYKFRHECENTVSGKSKKSVADIDTQDNTNDNAQISIYPNPAKDELIIECSQLMDNTYFELYGMIGNQVMKEKIETDRITISLKNIDKGIYLYKITQGGEILENNKLVIIK